MATDKQIEAAAWAIAKDVGKRSMLLEHDWKMARAALEAAERATEEVALDAADKVLEAASNENNRNS